MKKLIRDSVFKIAQYEPGKSIEDLRRKLALEGEIHKLASNENPLGPSPLAIEAIKKSLTEGNLYPDNSCHDLRERLSKHLGISPNNLVVGNGTTELIFLMGVAFLNPGETFIMSESSFIMGKVVAQVMDCRLIEVPLKDYRHNLDAILRKITEETKIVYLDNPMNPIGERWIGLVGIDEHTKDLSGLGMHGTIDPDSIGTNSSMGCVRMHGEDVSQMYEMLVGGVSTVEIR